MINQEQEQNNKVTKKINIRIPRVEIRAFPGWLSKTTAGWKSYFVDFPDRVRALTRREIKQKVARYLQAFIITYFIVGVMLGIGFYSLRLPLNNSFGRFAASIYPFPAELVGFETITLKDIAEQEEAIYFFANKTGSSVGSRLEVDAQVMGTLEEIRLAQNTLRQYGLYVTNDDVDTIMDAIEEENGGKEQVSELLDAMYGLTIPEFREIVRDQLAEDKVGSEVMKNLKVRHILVSEEQEAKDIKVKIENGEMGFQDAAKQYSKDEQTKEDGGLLAISEDNTYINRDSGLVSEFMDVAYKLNKNEVSDPVKTEYGWHLIVVTDIKGELDTTYADWLKNAQESTLIWRLYRP